MEGGVSIRKFVPILADHGTENGVLLVDSMHSCTSAKKMIGGNY